MDSTGYDQSDPWHSTANLLFGFLCYHCSARVDINWEGWDTDYDTGFRNACVEVSERAKREGWVAINEWRFLCPKCAAKCCENPLELRPADAGDLRDLHQLHVRAFKGRSNEAVLVELLHAANKASPSLVAVDGGGIVGHVAFSPMELQPAREDLRIAALGPVAVSPEYQRRGIGSRLIRTGLDECRRAGVDVVAVLGSPRYYGRFGFVPAMDRGLRNEYVQDEHFMILELRRDGLDGVTGLLKYAPEFAAAGC